MSELRVTRWKYCVWKLKASYANYGVMGVDSKKIQIFFVTLQTLVMQNI